MDEVKDISKSKGVKEILLWRLSTAVIWSVASQVFILAVFLSLINLDLMHPIVGFQRMFRILFTWHTLVHLIPLGAITFAQGVICSKEYITGNPLLLTRFSIILNVLSLRNIVLCGLHLLAGVLTSWLYLSLLTPYNSGLNEPTLFIITNGLSVGFYYFVKEHGVISFPVIEQNTFLQVKSTIFQLFSRSLINATIPVGYYIILYYFYGNRIRSFLTLEDPGVDTGIIQPILYSWLNSSLFLFTMSMMEILFKVNLTRRHIFPIMSPNVLTLGEGICLNKLPIIQHLACLDLFKLASNDSVRRQLIFQISQPGGHCYNWNSILTSSLYLIDDYTQSLKEEPTQETYEPVIAYEPYRLRNMRYSTEVCDTPPNVIESNPWDNLNKKLNAITQSIPGVNYFFGELKDARIKYILSQGQPIVWTVQGLSILATKSIQEDNFGVVHKDLPAILTSMVRLSQAVEKVVAKKGSNHWQMQTSLKLGIKRSLCNICNKFGGYVHELSIPTEIKLYVMAFMIKKEI